LDREGRHKWRELGCRYGEYSQLPLSERQHLVAETRRWLQQIDQSQRASSPLAQTQN